MVIMITILVVIITVIIVVTRTIQTYALFQL
jgi:hypothetical protein